MKPLSRLFVISGIFAVAMGFLEAAVVIYLRAIYYPEGFAFPMKNITGTIAVTEVLREAATLIMLLAVAWLSVKSALERLAVFIYAFAVWDITYYVFLFLLFGWPSSLFTWDLLFLIPVPWTGPVLAPVINSLTMILLAAVILTGRSMNTGFRILSPEWLLVIMGSLITVLAYSENYLRFLHSVYSIRDILKHGIPETSNLYTMMFIPTRFNWILFILGEILFLLAILPMIRRMKER